MTARELPPGYAIHRTTWGWSLYHVGALVASAREPQSLTEYARLAGRG